jgi:endonuclease G
VVLHRRRRLALLTAVNIDGQTIRRDELKRTGDRWVYDPRVGREEQLGQELYTGSKFNRGHLVRRLDPAWGDSLPVAKAANDDTFHFTNCSPQHEDFNQGKNLWAGLENYLLEKAEVEGRRLTVFTGPVFRQEDPRFRGVQIPKEFWKVAVYAKPGAGLVAAAFIVNQADLMQPVVTESAAERVAKTFQTTVGEVERLTGLSFGNLRDLDTLAPGALTFAPGEEAPRIELADFGEITLG